MYAFLLAQLKETSLCWDVATGNGQAAVALAKHFDKVVASDGSTKQLEQAFQRPNIEYRCEPAEQSSLADNSVDLVTVAQALHWFDFDAFYREVQRVVKPGGVIAVWTYGVLSVDKVIDEKINHFYSQVLGPYWPPERRFVDKQYKTLAFPFNEIVKVPELSIEKTWTLDQLCGYLESWSAVQKYKNQTGSSGIEAIRQALQPLWIGTQTVNWPLVMRVGHNNA